MLHHDTYTRNTYDLITLTVVARGYMRSKQTSRGAALETEAIVGVNTFLHALSLCRRWPFLEVAAMLCLVDRRKNINNMTPAPTPEPPASPGTSWHSLRPAGLAPPGTSWHSVRLSGKCRAA
eukprot:362137-Chlamydomonas_euryale.AAC.1